jgi:hypothetical protein
MLRPIQFIAGLILLIAIEILKVYYIMPFPGSQQSESVDMAYFIHDNIIYLRIMGILIIVFPAIYYVLKGKWSSKILVCLGLIIYVYVFIMFNYRFLADKMFIQPTKIILQDSNNNVIKPEQLVLGVSINGNAKAYPVQLIGYHHQVRDTLAGQQIMVTYCTVCRTGRVFSPTVNGKAEEFRLVGMDQYNAMFEDKTTGSWWRQVNGEAVAGPLKGKFLTEIPSQQMSLKAWLTEYPNSKILQPDTVFKEEYADMEGYEKGKGGRLTGKDSLSWQPKSWVVGVQIGMQARAYDWIDLTRLKVINDTLNEVPIVIALESDSATFHVWKRDSLVFTLTSDSLAIKDTATGSTWTWQGVTTSGPLKDKRLPVVQSYQEFLHSWETFRPQSTRYKPED